MGILNSILKVLSGRGMAPKPNTAVTETAHGSSDLDSTSTTTTLTTTTDPSSDTAESLATLLTEDVDMASTSSSSSSPSESSSTSSSSTMSLYPFVFGAIEHTNDNTVTTTAAMSTATATAGGQHKTIVRTTTTTTDRSSTLATAATSFKSILRPSKRRQEGDLTADIEATVMALDIDRDSTRPHSYEGDHHDTQGFTSSENDDDPTALALSKKNEKATTYPLVQNRMFDIPEIIRSIAEFLDKPSLAASCRVSKIWATHCTPLLWKHVVDKYWRDSRFYASIRSRAHYIRTMKCEDKTDYEEMLLCDLPRLRAIGFHGNREPMAVKDKVLTKVRNTLTSLVLSSVCTVLPGETVRAIRELRQLTTLKLLNVNLEASQLAEILMDCENLEFLSLSRVRLALGGDSGANAEGAIEGEGNIWAGVIAAAAAAAAVTAATATITAAMAATAAPPGVWGAGTSVLAATNNATTTTTTTTATTVATTTTTMSTAVTRIKYLALKEVTVLSSYLTSLIRNCPDLLELSMARNENLSVSTDMIRTMRGSCPRLYALDLGSCKQIDRGAFSTLFTSIAQLTVINLSGTRVADEELLLLAESCKNVTRLDIQYCTAITSKGLHQFLSNCKPSLRHLEASGVTIEPDTFDHNPWTCTNLEILFVHIGLVGSAVPSRMALVEEANAMGEVTAMTVDSVANEKKRSQDAIVVTPGASSTSRSSGNAAASSNQTFTASTGIAASSSVFSSGTEYDPAHLTDSDGDVVMRHPLHPIQDMCNIQYLGLMGCGPKLTCATQNQLIQGFRSVKRLHVLGLYQAFKKEDLRWLVENLPELCRIDAEQYNVSDEVMKWFEETYPRIQICRQE